MGMSFSKLQELMMDREAWHAVVHGAVKSQTRLTDWTKGNLSMGTEEGDELVFKLSESLLISLDVKAAYNIAP